MLCAHGCKLALTDVNAAGGEEVVKALQQEFPDSPEPCFIQADVTSEQLDMRICYQLTSCVGSAALEAFVTKAKEHLDGQLDALVNVAGINLVTPVQHKVAASLLAQTIDVNLKGPWRLCQLFVDAVLKQDASKAPKGGYSIV